MIKTILNSLDSNINLILSKTVMFMGIINLFNSFTQPRQLF